jgi:hypothetical protein
MFGINDPSIWFAYLLALGFALACVLYGLMNWHDGGDETHGG